MPDSQKYIVVFKSHVSADEIDKFANDLNNNGGEVRHRYGSVLNGFSAVIPDAFFQSLQADDAIDYIELDGTATIQ